MAQKSRRHRSFLCMERLLVVLHTGFLSSSALFLSFQISSSTNTDCCHVCLRNASGVSHFLPAASSLLIPLGTSCCPRLSCLASLELTFQKQQTQKKNYQREHILCYLQITLETTKCNEFNY